MASTGEAWRLGRRPALDGLRDAAWVLADARLVVFAASVLFVARGWAVLWSPRMFAEDGQVFLSQAYNLGLSAIWEPYAGYLHAAPRLVAAAAHPLPLTLVPAVYAFAAVAGYLAASALVLSPRVGWLLPTPLARAVAFAALCVIPPNFEVYANIANLVAVAGIGLLLLSLADDPDRRSTRGAELGGAVFAGLSGPYSLLLAPLFGWRWWRTRSRHSLRLAVIVAACGLTQLVLVVTSSRDVSEGGAEVFVPALVERVGGGWVFGYADVFATTTTSAAPYLAAGTVLFVAAAVTIHALRWTGVVLWVALLGLVAVTTQTYGAWFIWHAWNMSRQLAVPFAVLVVLLVAAAWRATGRAWVRATAAGCLMLGVLGTADRFTMTSYPVASDMDRLQACVDAGRPVCSVLIYGPGWRVRIAQ